MMERFLEGYASILARYPIPILVIVLLLTIGLASGGQYVETVQQNEEDILPDTIASIDAFNTINAEFGSAGATTYTILIETAPSYANSTEIRDVRDPRLLRFVATMTNDIHELPQVTEVTSPSGLYEQTPASIKDTQKMLDAIGKARWGRMISDDYTAIKIDADAESVPADRQMELGNRIRETIEAHDKPAGLRITYTGQTYIDEAFQEQSQQTTNITSIVAFAGVLVIVIGLFRSIFFGLTTLMALLIGIATGYGLFGFFGYNLAPATSGAISIGVGIAIDFGIQPVARYREEREELGIEAALEETFKGIYRPMTLGLIAALLGFASLSFGQITFLSSLGVVLSLTTLMAYLSAFTFIPLAIIIHDRYVVRFIDTIRT